MKKTMMLVLALVLCMAAMGAQALTMTGLENDAEERQWEDHLFFSRMQALTGVEMKAHGVSDQAEYAKLIDGMQAGAVEHDVLFKANLSRGQEIALLDSGAVIDLAPHIEKSMPNLSALLEAHPQWKEIISLEDGRIASLPLLNMQERQAFMWINSAWLEKLGLAVPETLEELTHALKAFADGDPNGNGKKDELSLDLLGVYEMRWLLPYFGIVADDRHLARNAQGEIVFAPELPAYRSFIEQLKAWHDAGVLRRDAFTAMHGALALGKQEDENVRSGMFLSVTPYTHAPMDAVMEYVPLLLAGPDGSVRWRDLLGEVWTGCFAVTSRCPDVDAALRWADALYTGEGALLAFAGAENEDYRLREDGSWEFVLDGGRDISEIINKAVIYTGAQVPGLYPADFIARVDSPMDRHVFSASERVRAVSEQVVPAYALNQAQQARADELAGQLCALVDQGIARFVMGDTPLDDESYAAWLEELAAAGSGELTALYAGL